MVGENVCDVTAKQATTGEENSTVSKVNDNKVHSEQLSNFNNNL